MDAATAINAAFMALEVAALLRDHAQRQGATAQQLEAYREKALAEAAATAAAMRAAQGPEVGG